MCCVAFCIIIIYIDVSLSSLPSPPPPLLHELLRKFFFFFFLNLEVFYFYFLYKKIIHMIQRCARPLRPHVSVVSLRSHQPE